jgi:hypothetical protein
MLKTEDLACGKNYIIKIAILVERINLPKMQGIVFERI